MDRPVCELSACSCHHINAGTSLCNMQQCIRIRRKRGGSGALAIEIIIIIIIKKDNRTDETVAAGGPAVLVGFS